MNTKKRILDEAMTLFSEKGYANVFVADIAKAVGIKAPSLYKHYKSKQDIFNTILDEMKNRYDMQASMLNMNGNNATADAEIFAGVSEDTGCRTSQENVCLRKGQLLCQQRQAWDQALLSRTFQQHLDIGVFRIS